MLRKTRLVLCVAALLIALCTLGTAMVYQIGALQPENAPAGSVSQQKTLALAGQYGENPLYIVREYEGQICVFLPEGSMPELMTGIQVSTLPSKDQRMLQEGIGVESQEALASILEDFGY